MHVHLPESFLMTKPHPLATLAWGLLLLSALAVGLFSLRYALPGMPISFDLPSLQQSRQAFVVHAVSASLALMLLASMCAFGTLIELSVFNISCVLK